MTDRITLKRHVDLLDRMAATLGLDLEDELFHGKLAPQDVPEALLRCTECVNPRHCETWLKDHSEGAVAPPGYCRNAALLTRLYGKPPARS